MGRPWREFLTRAAPLSLEFDEYMNEYLYEYWYANLSILYEYLHEYLHNFVIVICLGQCWEEFLTRAAPPSLEFDEYLNEYLYANFYESCIDICMNICIKKIMDILWVVHGGSRSFFPGS